MNQPAQPRAILEINGFGDKGVSNTLQVSALGAETQLRFNASTKSALSTTFARTPYLESALVYQGSAKWRLFYAAPPSGVITVTNVRAHIIVSESADLRLLRSGPQFSVGSASVISPTGTGGSALKADESIKLINVAMGWPEGEPAFGGEAALLLLSDGKAENPYRTLVVFGSVQPDGNLDPPAPGGPFNPWDYCTTSLAPPFWCYLIFGW